MDRGLKILLERFLKPLLTTTYYLHYIAKRYDAKCNIIVLRIAINEYYSIFFLRSTVAGARGGEGGVNPLNPPPLYTPLG